MARVFRSSAEAAGVLQRPSVAIGNFDGVHCGHQALIDQLLQLKQSKGTTPTVLTFDPHPARFFRKELAPPLLTTEAQKIALLSQASVEAVVIEPFTGALARLTPEAFIRQVLIDRLCIADVIVGADFIFGHQRTGNADTLRTFAENANYQAHIIEPVSVADMVASSTKIREFVMLGRVEGAALLLGRDYAIAGQVVRGEGRGRTIGVPTANLNLDNEVVPGRGVYAAYVDLPTGVRVKAAVNVGLAPTFGGKSDVTVEAHLLEGNYEDDALLGTQLTLHFHKKLRDEKRFDGADALIAQIKRDIDHAKAAL